MPSLLACSGGGDKLSLLFGILSYMSKNKKQMCDWDTVAGISAGSIVGGVVSNTTKDTLEEKMDEVEKYIMSHTVKVTTPWVYGGTVINSIDAFMFHKGFFSHVGLKKNLKQFFDDKHLKRHLLVGTYNETNPGYRTWNSNTFKDMSDAIVASCCVPAVFEPYNIQDNEYLDGSMRHLIPVEEIKEWVRETHGPKRVDIMLCYPMHDKKMFVKITSEQFGSPFLSSLTQAVSHIMLEQFENDLKEVSVLANVPYDVLIHGGSATYMHNNVTYNIYAPLIGVHTTFTAPSRETSIKLFEQGKDVAKSLLNRATLKM